MTENTVIPVAALPPRFPVPWRDPHTLPAGQLNEAIQRLERECAANPNSPDLRVCLGMAYAMRLDVYPAMDALEVAVQLDPNHFLAQFKRAELLYRLRALPRAEQETLRALELAGSPWEIAVARRQLQEIRRLIREGTQKPAWTKSLAGPLMALAGLVVACVLVFLRWG